MTLIEPVIHVQRPIKEMDFSVDSAFRWKKRCMGHLDSTYPEGGPLSLLELRKKPPTFTFICRLIWGTCAKGKCWFAKARESKSAPRKPRQLTRKHVHVLILGIWYGKSAKGSRKMCERFAKAEVFKVQESPFSRSALNGKCKAFLWKY